MRERNDVAGFRPPADLDVSRDLRARLRRLLDGGRQAADLDRLYLGLRERAKDLEAVREIGDFIAHRETREKGVLSAVFRDVFTSLDIWSRPMRGVGVAQSDVAAAAAANLRLATDQQLRDGCGSTRSQATQRLKRALAKIGSRPLTQSEHRTLRYLGTAFIWKPAFTADQLCQEFAEAVQREGLIDAADVASVRDLHAFLAVHALSVMHGSKLKLANGLEGRLWAGYANRDRFLEVKVEIGFEDAGKPISSPICLFYAELAPEAHCDADLLESEPPLYPWHWSKPIEVKSNGRLGYVE